MSQKCPDPLRKMSCFAKCHAIPEVAKQSLGGRCLFRNPERLGATCTLVVSYSWMNTVSFLRLLVTVVPLQIAVKVIVTRLAIQVFYSLLHQ